MLTTKMMARITLLLGLTLAGPLLWREARPVAAHAAVATPEVAVGPQYDTTHVYVAPEAFDRFVASLIATFGGTTTKEGVVTVTPTPSSTMSQLALTHAGTVSVFGFKTPVPYPFGVERTGYLVTDMDAAIRAARSAGADVIVSAFNDPVGRDAISSGYKEVRPKVSFNGRPRDLEAIIGARRPPSGNAGSAIQTPLSQREMRPRRYTCPIGGFWLLPQPLR